MVVLDLHGVPVEVRYKNTLLSKASLFVIVIKCACLLFPFIVAFRSRGFWMKEDEFYEQPNIKYRGEYFFASLTSNATYPIITHNLPQLESFKEFGSTSEITARESDSNHDTKVDEFEFSIKVDLPEDFRLIFFFLIVPIDYRLKTTCPMHMQSAIIIQQNIPDFVNELIVFGDLRIKQSYPLYCYIREVDKRYNYSIFDGINNDQVIEEIFSTYLQRNITTHLSNQLLNYKPGSPKEYFKITAHIKYIYDKILYRPGFWQVMKWAWIQYFSIYIIFSWVLNNFMNYVFINKLFLFYESPVKKRNQM